MRRKYKIAVIGAGAGGQTMAGHLALMGYDVTLFTRDPAKAAQISARGGIELDGRLEGLGVINEITYNLADAIKKARLSWSLQPPMHIETWPFVWLRYSSRDKL